MSAATKQNNGCLTDQEALQFTLRYHLILAQGDTECPAPDNKKQQDKKRGRSPKTKSRNLIERLQTFEAETLRFMTNPLVPFTNNQAENDLRMTKVQQKISGCFRSFQGALSFCRIRSYISSCSKHHVSATDALNSLFNGKLPDFLAMLV